MAERDGTVYLSCDVDPIRVVKADLLGWNSCQVQYVTVAAIEGFLDPLYNNLENRAMEVGLIDLAVLLVAA